MNAATLPPIVAPASRDFEELAALIIPWLGPRLGNAESLRLRNFAYPRGAGMSHETILFDAQWRVGNVPVQQGFVVRIKPTLHLVYQDDMFDAQCRLMQLMRNSGKVRVARILSVEPTSHLLGAPFFVMEQVHGRIAVSYPPYAQEGWLFDAAPEDRARLWEDAVRQLALIQKVPIAEASFLDAAAAFPDGFEQEIDRWRRFLDWVDPDGQLILLRDGFARLLAIMPVGRQAGIVWGDARLGNMMVGEDFKISAVMDWEQPSLGGALHDLGWWLYSDEVQTTARGLARLEGMGSRQETIDLWCDVSGKSAADIDWYEAFAIFKMECLGVRMTALRGAGSRAGAKPPGTILLQRVG